MSTDNRAMRMARRGAVSAIVAAVALPAFAFSAPAQADTAQTTTGNAAIVQTTVRAAAPNDTVGQIAKGLIDSRLYITSEAGNVLSPADQNEIKTALGGDSDADIRAVVVRNDITPTEVRQLLPAIADRVGKGETFVAITADGSRMGGISKKLDSTEINQLVTRTNGESLKDRLIKFGDLAEQKVDDGSRSNAIAGFVMLGVLVTVVALVTGGFLVARRRRREREAREMADLKAGVQEDVTLLGEDIARLDLNVMDSGLDPDIRADYERAMNSYDDAKRSTERAARPQDMQAVTTALEDGRYYMTATRARLAGEPVPERRAPCFFNPQHGPSVQDVLWAPPGGTERSVPACAADARAVQHGADPDVRMVPYGGGRRPYWNAGPAYAPYAGGYYAGYGGLDLLSGLMIGTMLGSMMSGGWGGYGGDAAGGLGGDGDIGGGWDFGGGDFGGFGGGGDFGGF
ncbi:hypothetical protein BZB76_1636 [Actinomadura pelletieri DSM 43383]|uniref:Membrane protein YgcG n=1 Tax=Actinomadura pelletieri DSM 43383 TaxID=1120940 RepID=A0A495QS02_9ACTN|nr:hypothetical protein [Actinomadura pelletieri]RKS76285.1 hypothetical protein BZB76_1636 [Actinomadura pelletieri DSM 43383]